MQNKVKEKTYNYSHMKMKEHSMIAHAASEPPLVPFATFFCHTCIINKAFFKFEFRYLN